MEQTHQTPRQHPEGRDTPTGTDEDARYAEPGYEDKSFGQAVDEDEELAERLAAETGDDAEAERRFEREATGAPARQRQSQDGPAGRQQQQQQ
ncbi:MAG: hypothetical protein S0880_08730 [Actinomycetota bacterium]|nr:hypothetical protein [Actinomycetota bacterium]